ncbi:MAG: YybH family protein [Gemmatimonadaceae bacterium]
MRRFSLFAAAVVLGLPMVGLSQARPSAPQLPSVTLPPELDRVLRDYEVAWRASDANGLAQLFADGRVVMTNSGRAVSGREAVRQVYSRGGGPLSLRAMAYAVDDTVAHIIGAYATRPGEEDSGTFVLALVRPRAGKWLISADMDRAHRQ